MYKLIYSVQALRQLEKLQKNISQRILLALERIRINPRRHVIKLVGESCYRLRVGDYRAIMDIEDDKLIILVIKIAHRKNIYKEF